MLGQPPLEHLFQFRNDWAFRQLSISSVYSLCVTMSSSEASGYIVLGVTLLWYIQQTTNHKAHHPLAVGNQKSFSVWRKVPHHCSHSIWISVLKYSFTVYHNSNPHIREKFVDENCLGNVFQWPSRVTTFIANSSYVWRNLNPTRELSAKGRAFLMPRWAR